MAHSVVIASVGRADVLAATVRHLLALSTPPDEVVVSCAAESDVTAETVRRAGVRVVTGPKGLPRQRNRGADAARPDADWISFLDDDVALRDDALAEAGAFLVRRPDVVALSGAVLADGVRTGGIARPDAEALLAGDAAAHPAPPQSFHDEGLYGCNMHVRRSALDRVRFDERLPGYAWLEDRDFSERVRGLGRVGRFTGSRVVHLGVPSGRQPGLRMGYAQVVNPLYLWRRAGSLPARDAAALVGRVTLRNLAGALRPDPLVDRRGRLRGNARGLADAFRGRLDPERMLDL